MTPPGSVKRDWLKPLAKHVFYPLYVWKDGMRLWDYLEEFERTQYLSAAETAERQWSMLHAMVGHAYDHCAFYRRWYDEAGIRPGDIKRMEDFERLPLLSKQDIQRNLAGMVADNVPRARIIENYTGGSTGSPLRLYLDTDRRDSRAAGIIRHNRWAGLDIGDKVACLWGATADAAGRTAFKARLRNLLAERLLFLDMTRVNNRTIDAFLARMARYRPSFIMGYASALVLFARYLERHSEADFPRPRAIISSAEVLTSEDRALVERVYGCRVFDRYGCREASVLASECQEHRGLHVNAESVYMEFIRGGRPAKPGEVGEVVLTDLRNMAMPLIRYRIGDAGVPSGEACACGRGLPLMAMAAGRVTDFLVSAGGDLVSGIVLSTYLITKVPQLVQVQFRQEERGRITARVVLSGERGDESLSKLRGLMTDYLGSGTRLEVEEVDEIPREPSGKYRFTVSTLDPLSFIG